MWTITGTTMAGTRGFVVLPLGTVKAPVGSPAAPAAAAPDGQAADSAEALMCRYVEGDLVAFEEIYRHLSPRLFGYLMRLTRNRERAEDLVQITFSKVHRARDSYIPGASLLPWVLAIARRSFFDELRRAKVRPEDLTGDGVLPEPRDDEAPVGNDVAEALERSIGELPRSYAEAIQLTKITGLSVAEAAEVLGTTHTAVKLRVHRGYNILRKQLESYGRNI